MNINLVEVGKKCNVHDNLKCINQEFQNVGVQIWRCM